MNVVELARWQWTDYGKYHQDRISLAIHLVAVPLFWVGLALCLSAPWASSWLSFAAGVICMPSAIALQGVGHKREPVPAVPFSSPQNAIARLVLEQVVTFPRFVLSGRAFGTQVVQRAGVLSERT